MDKQKGIALIIAADEPALLYSTVQRAELDLEPIDVKDNIYTAAYGPDGQPFRITTDGWKVRIYRDDDAPNQREELGFLLVRLLRSRGMDVGATETIEDMLARCEPEF